MYKLSITLSFILRSTLSSCRAFCQSSDVQYTRVSQTISSANWLAPDLAHLVKTWLWCLFARSSCFHDSSTFSCFPTMCLYSLAWKLDTSPLHGPLRVPLGASKAHVPAGAAFGSRLESYAQRPDVFHPQLTHSPPFSPVAVKQDWLAPEVLSWPSFSSTTVKLMPVA
ncbi:hypothetical protein M758_4G209900 [Ceratodon purpureus]|nr:hypothetical protein M758_4G209900 [Ceratodon purpureus]